MATKREELDNAATGRGGFGKADTEEPVFILVAHDGLAPATIEAWIAHAQNSGVNQDKIRAARQVAARMRDWQYEHPSKVKVPD